MLLNSNEKVVTTQIGFLGCCIIIGYYSVYLLSLKNTYKSLRTVYFVDPSLDTLFTSGKIIMFHKP